MAIGSSIGNGSGFEAEHMAKFQTNGIWLSLVKSVIGSKKLPERGRTRLAKTLDWSYITGAHLARFGYVVPNCCPLCGEGSDNVWHRVWCCKHGDDTREGLDQALVAEARLAGDKHPLFARCLMYNPIGPDSRPNMATVSVFIQNNGSNECFTFDPADGPIGGDGSCFQSSDGWGHGQGGA